MFEIDLKWPVASGYEVRQREWPVPSEYVVRPITQGFAIYPREGATIDWRRPLEDNSTLYAEFAALDGSKKSCLQFAEKYGLLKVSAYGSDLFPMEPLEYWRWAVRYIRWVGGFCKLGMTKPAEAFRQFGKQEFALQGGLELSLSIKSSKSPPSIDMRCNSLLGAMELQAIRSSIFENRTAIQCIQCSNWFEIGSGARRSQAKFCSPRCKVRYHNRLKAEKRSKEK